VKHAVAVLRRTNELEANIARVWTAASSHLGEYAEAGIPDVDGAAEALAALHDLHLALGDRLDPEKLRGLVAADAFVCPELTGPATEVSLIISTWRSRTKQLNVVDAISYSAPQLQRWAADVADSLELLATLRDPVTTQSPALSTAMAFAMNSLVPAPFNCFAQTIWPSRASYLAV